MKTVWESFLGEPAKCCTKLFIFIILHIALNHIGGNNLQPNSFKALFFLIVQFIMLRLLLVSFRDINWLAISVEDSVLEKQKRVNGGEIEQICRLTFRMVFWVPKDTLVSCVLLLPALDRGFLFDLVGFFLAYFLLLVMFSVEKNSLEIWNRNKNIDNGNKPAYCDSLLSIE